VNGLTCGDPFGRRRAPLPPIPDAASAKSPGEVARTMLTHFRGQDQLTIRDFSDGGQTWPAQQ